MTRTSSSLAPIHSFRGVVALAIWVFLAAVAVVQGYRLNQQREVAIAATARGNLLKAVVDGVETGLIVVSTETGEIVEWSAGAQRLTGWTREEVLGRPLVYLMPTADRIRHEAYMANPQTVTDVTAQPVLVNCWAISKERKFVPVHVRIAATHTDPALFLVTIDNATNLRWLGAEQPPAEDPNDVATFQAK